MIRAGVFIGVDKTGGLQKLNDAAAGARRMYEWALAQGMTDISHAKLITDADGAEVHQHVIFKAIKEIIDGPGADQLIVYYAGHGAYINRNEHWLLTDAPVNASDAVNVTGNIDLARYCGIQHVVIIADACRVAPEGIQAQDVRGGDIFPNDPASDRGKPVDQFFACGRGKTAVEVKDPATIAGNYSALYTDALLEALKGERPEVLEPANAVGDSSHYVKTLRLETYLLSEVPRRVVQLNLQHKVNQNPDSIVTSKESWLARIDKPVAPAGGGPRSLPQVTRAPENLRSVSLNLLRSATEGNKSEFRQQMEEARTGDVAGADQLAETADRIAKPFGPGHFETQCGFKVRGARIVEFFAPRAQGELLGGAGDILRINHLEKPAASVLLRFHGNVGTVIPAIPGFIAALTFDERELVDVAYEPSDNTSRWADYQYQMEEVRALRAIAASASQHGRFRLEQGDANKLAQRMQNMKGNDPTLSVYAAYAYHDLQEIERIRAMSGYQRDDLGVTLFDLALLGRELIGKRVAPNAGIVPFFPLLSQGWALLQAHRIKLHPALDGIERNMRESLWSLFDPAGLEKLKRAMQTMEVR
jgi:hypothetical protein